MCGRPGAAAPYGDGVTGFPLPGAAAPAVAAPAPGAGPGRWAGAPSSALDDDGGIVVAYRVRDVEQGMAAIVIARSPDGEHLTPVARLDRTRFAARSVERPALLRTEAGHWRVYVCCSTPGSKHWWIDALQAAEPAGLGDAEARRVFPGDEHTGVKDPVVRRAGDRWEAWICCHPLDEPGEEDRMTTAYATSLDGLSWRWHGTVLSGRRGKWDARGARVTAVLPGIGAAYDGRATKEENFMERTGLAGFTGSADHLAADGDVPVSTARYVDVLPMADGGYRLYYEAPLPDGSHELRTELIARVRPTRRWHAVDP
jgi:hypothetical protein